MNNFGFVKIAAASPAIKVADCDFNTQEILKTIESVDGQDISAIVFPELCITSYSAADLLHQDLLLKEAKNSLKKICEKTKDSPIIIVVGAPFIISNKLYNVAVVIYGGEILGIVPKTHLPNSGEYYEMRWFSPSHELHQQSVSLFGKEVPVGTNLIFNTPQFNFAIEICEDLWSPIAPSSFHSLHGADIIFNLSASNEIAGKQAYRKALVTQQSARCIGGYVYAAAGNGESTTDLVFSGCSMIAENGELLSEMERFSFESKIISADIDIERIRGDRMKNKSFNKSDLPFSSKLEYRQIEMNAKEAKKGTYKLNRYIDPRPFVPTSNELLNERCNEIFDIQVGGLAKRLLHTNIQKSVIGISGGLDSTLALLVLVRAYDKLNISRDNIVGITMPGFGTTDRTYSNAISLMNSLGISSVEIPIRDAVTQHFKDIDHDINIHDVTYENSQARERTQILMDYANKANGLVIGTGDLSELALGWCTYNGDHMSMYAVNSGIPKTLVHTLVRWASSIQTSIDAQKILTDILDTPVSPELLPADKHGNIAQITEDFVGPYVLHDFYLYYTLRFGFTPSKVYFLAQFAFQDEYSKEEILKWLKTFYRRFFSQQFKRSCMPDGPKVGSINLSPRGDWRMPSDASAALWLKDLTSLS